VVILKPEFQNHGLDSWADRCQVCPLAPICQIKRHGEGQRKIFFKRGMGV
jgi:hypothetical protein